MTVTLHIHIHWIIEKARELKKITSALLTMLKHLTGSQQTSEYS